MSDIEKLWCDGVPNLPKRVKTMEQIFTKLATLGPANFVYSNGDYLYAFANKRVQFNGKIAPRYVLANCSVTNVLVLSLIFRLVLILVFARKLSSSRVSH